MLIQQRSFSKGSYPGKWATTGGHPKSGETSRQGMLTEINEELGIVLQENELEFVDTFIDGDTFVDTYYLKKDLDINDMVLQKEEVEAVKWVSINEFEKMFSNKEVKAIICSQGGQNSNAIIPYLDYELIKSNPKIIMGISDSTAILNAMK